MLCKVHRFNPAISKDRRLFRRIQCSSDIDVLWITNTTYAQLLLNEQITTSLRISRRLPLVKFSCYIKLNCNQIHDCAFKGNTLGQVLHPKLHMPFSSRDELYANDSSLCSRPYCQSLCNQLYCQSLLSESRLVIQWSCKYKPYKTLKPMKRLDPLRRIDCTLSA